MYPPTSKCRRLVRAMQLSPSEEQIDGRKLGDILATAIGGSSEAVGSGAKA